MYAKTHKDGTAAAVLMQNGLRETDRQLNREIANAIEQMRREMSAAMVGQIIMFGGTTPPGGWKKCDGSAISRADYSALFNVIGTTWGSGNGTTTFNLPDLRGRAPIGAGQGSGLTSRTLGTENIGVEDAIVPYHRHNVAKITDGIESSGGHSHDVQVRTVTDSVGSGSNYSRLASSGSNWVNNVARTNSNGAHTHDLPQHYTDYEGVTATGKNMQPSAVVNFIIYTGVI